MKSFLVTYRNENKKLGASKLSKITFIILAIIVLVFGIAVGIIQNSLGIGAISASELAIWTLDSLAQNLLLFFTIIMASHVFTNEDKANTYNNVFLKPVTRIKIYLAKNLAIGTYVLKLLGIQMGISIVIGLIFGGLTNPASLLTVLAAYVGSLVVLVLFGLMTSLISQFFSSTSPVLIVTIVIVGVLNILSGVFSSVNIIMPTSYFNFSSYLLEGNSTGLLMLLFIISYYIILTILGIFRFDKKEI